MRRPFLILLIALAVPLPARSEPPTPETYRVYLRYQIHAFGNDRIIQYRDMVKKLKGAGFEMDARPEDDEQDVNATLLTGTIPSKEARTLLLEKHVRAVLLAGKDDARLQDLHDKGDTVVRVQLELTPQASTERRMALLDSLRDCLTPLGFHEGFAYDHQAHTRMVGAISKSKLETLLYDLKSLPEGGRVPSGSVEKPAIRVVEVMPESYPEIPALKAAPIPTAPDFERIGPSLLALLKNKEEAAKPARLEIVLVFDPSSKEHPWEAILRKIIPDLLVEGRIGTLVTVTTKAENALLLARLPEVSLVRLPERSTRATIIGENLQEEANIETLKASGAERLHKLKFIGQGVNVAIVDDDFRGWEELVGKRLPKATRYIDFTAERSPSLTPAPFPDGQGLGHGTRAALVALLGAPGANVILVRIDPATPYHLADLLHHIHGDAVASPLLDLRRLELDDARGALDRRRTALLAERKDILSDFGQDPETKKKREAYFKKEKDLERDEQAQADLLHRYLDLLQTFRELRKVRAVVSPFLWNEGHPVDGGSGPSRFFDDRPFRSVLWFQAVGNTRGQTWSGLFRDADGDGVMEFAPLPDPTKLEKTWRLEMNRLAWQADGGAKGEKSDPSLEIPAKTRLRITMQWREPHDPEFYKAGEDVYARPLAKLKLVVMRQLDPEGNKGPTDDLQLIEQSAGPPFRIQNEANSAVYEQPLQFEIAEAGHYVLRVEGRVPADIRPPGVSSLPGKQQRWDLKLRIYIETLSEGGHVIFRDYVNEDGGIAAPADARHVIAVGAVDADGKPRSYSVAGSPFDVELLHKPDLLSYDSFAVDGGVAGTEYAASFAAGVAACMLSGQMSPEQFFKDVTSQRGQVLRVPEKWPERGSR